MDVKCFIALVPGWKVLPRISEEKMFYNIVTSQLAHGEGESEGDNSPDCIDAKVESVYLICPYQQVDWSHVCVRLS
jgi:hypothetical protein